MDAYATALANQPASHAPRPIAGPGTFAALATRYYGSPKYLALSTSSRGNYRRVIDGFLEEHGHRRVDQMRREHVDSVIGKMANRPGAAIVLLKRIRTLLKYAVAIGWIDRDPSAGVQSYRSTEIHIWTEDEIASFERRWPVGSRKPLAFALLLYTGQRGSDVRRMTWSDIVGQSIRVTQTKTRAKLVIPLHPSLLSILAVERVEHVAILTTAYGQPFSVKGFGQMVSAAITAAGLPARCKAHGLRKAAARRLAEAGATANEIAAVTGHKTLAEVERYTRAADQEHLAQEAIRKQSVNNEWQTSPDRVANQTDKAS